MQVPESERQVWVVEVIAPFGGVDEMIKPQSSSSFADAATTGRLGSKPERRGYAHRLASSYSICG